MTALGARKSLGKSRSVEIQVSGEEAKEPSQRGDIMLETSPAQACAGFGYVRFDIAGPNTFHGGVSFLQVLEETLRSTPVA